MSYEYFIMLILIVVSMLLFMFIEAFRNRVRETTVHFSSYPQQLDPLHIFFISDIHKRKVSDKIIAKVRKKADFVIIGGDLLEKGVELEKVGKNIDKLNQIAPIYFVWGNNDYEVDRQNLQKLFQDKGVTEIVNSSIVIRENEFGKVTLIGVDDASLRKADLNKAYRDVEEQSFNILISHDPRLIRKLTDQTSVDLMLSGHTHGGQIRIFGLGLYPKGKLDTFHNTTQLVSNGYGTTAIPFRLGAPAETHLLSIKRS